MIKKPRTPDPPKPKAAAPVRSMRSTPWHAVVIVATAASCEAARALRGTRFLSAKAPRLPLERCPQSDSCPCSYKHHADRRAQPRRKDELTGMRQPAKVSQERRLSRNRRQSDI